MPIFNYHLPARLLSLALVVAAPLAVAQTVDDSRWYKVEILVIAHTNPAALRAEHWPALPSLEYPEPARFLLDPERIIANLESVAAPGQAPAETPESIPESEIDEFGRQLIYLPAETFPVEGLPSEDLPVAPDDRSALAGNPATDDSTGIPTEQAAGEHAERAKEPETTDAETPPRLPVPFVLLPASEREFRGKAAYMERNGQYRILFHETWWQPVDGEQDALPIILDRSGDTGTYPLLQGSIALHRSRFLHIATQLWLNTDGSYLPDDWQMPAPPKGPASLQVIEPPPLNPPGDPDNHADPDTHDDGLIGLDLEPLAEPEPGLAMEAPEIDEAGAPLSESELDIDDEPGYPYRHAVALQQERKMRSNEVHYIDHPLFGVIVKFTPLEVDDLKQADYDEEISPYLSRQAEPEEPAAGSPAEL
ncbi:hypothetical protein CWI75_10515 [Kineobactrum sediminis]|uniref:Uncharacterized protein n=1 Tax=Kineobactrum sediminis TaxID=1905677 RepID=A0A2N5Y1G9_9GAMM|nr:CsiV family protein [Kineobactrum sediminis]PLW82209.1 hypothetical protein CWI75_10515 [Kineobactrum sediminis]